MFPGTIHHANLFLKYFMKCLCFVFKSACSSWIKYSGTLCSIRNHNILKQRDKLENLQTQIQFIQGCGIRTFPIGGILDAPSQVTGSPTSTAVINNAVFVSKLIRLVFFNLLLDCSIQLFYIICTIHLFFQIHSSSLFCSRSLIH